MSERPPGPEERGGYTSGNVAWRDWAHGLAHRRKTFQAPSKGRKHGAKAGRRKGGGRGGRHS